MYRIAVCDNNRLDLSALQNAVESILNKHGVEYQISLFESYQSMISAWDRGMFHLLILDIMLDNENGIEVAQGLRRQNSRVGIIFVTAYPEYALKGYSVQPIQYLLKPVQPEALEEALCTHYEHFFKPQTLILKAKDGTCSIPLRDISHIEIYGHTATVHTEAGLTSCSAKLSELEQRLASLGFVRCHKSFLVHLRHIRYIKRYEICLKNNSIIPVGKARYADVQSAFIRFHDSDDKHIYI